MFAIEIDFNDRDGGRETILVRRPLVVIGPDEAAHVVIEDAALSEQLILMRQLGRRFRTARLRDDREVIDEDPLASVDHEDEAVLALGAVTLRIVALDMDLTVRSGEPADRAAVRVLREATSAAHPLFPALVLRGESTIVFSFAPELPVLVGRSRECSLRVDSSYISSRHAQFGFENGKFWVEDLGSTNGTFKNGSRIAGRVNLGEGEQITLGMDLTVAGVVSGDQIVNAASWQSSGNECAPSYPVLLSNSDVVRPARIALVPDVPLHLGRDPSSELWIGAPHVSRKHAVAQLEPDGRVRVTVRSPNGLGFGDGILQAEESVIFPPELVVFDFGGGVTVALCFNEREESQVFGLRESTLPTKKSGPRRPKSLSDKSEESAGSLDAEDGENVVIRPRRRSEDGEEPEGPPSGSDQVDGQTKIVDRLRLFMGRISSGR